MKPNSIASQVGGANPLDFNARSNRPAARADAEPVWKRSDPATSNGPAVRPAPPPGAGPKHGAISHRPASSQVTSYDPPHVLQGMAQRNAGGLQGAADRPNLPSAHAPSSPGIGTRVANAFKETHEEALEGIKADPWHAVFRPVNTFMATALTFFTKLFK